MEWNTVNHNLPLVGGGFSQKYFGYDDFVSGQEQDLQFCVCIKAKYIFFDCYSSSFCHSVK